MLSWFSPGLQQRTGLSMGCLRSHASAPISHDHFFHSVLGLMDVQTRVYQPALDALMPCSAAAQAKSRASEQPVTRSPAA